MTAAPDRIGGESEYDRAVVLAEALGVRVVETTQAYLIERWACPASAALITRSRRVSLRGITNDAEQLAPGESRVYLSERRHGDALAVLHELGHAALHANNGENRERMETRDLIRQEIEAWNWAIKRLGRDLTPRERQEITECLRGYGMHLSEIRTHVLLTNAA